ncbi:MAG: hypothetical protein CFE21_00540 [Bacteroidetes bacterium B1(2017)]|nr:MAG: hypothetical protein CFE21_00540 [Bacteroidetes bacterium B1(2017)]
MNLKTQKILAGFSFLLLLFGLFQMSTLKPQSAIKAVYWWKTTFSKSSYYNERENAFMQSHSIKKMYVKLLDVDYSPGAGIFPASKTRIEYYLGEQTDSCEYIPVIYITKEVLLHLDSSNLDYYAKNFLTQALRIETHIKHPVNEIQIDCDWTKETKNTYFKLLLCLKKWAPQYQYSATLRLYPYKYRTELGIPPVNRVMLMVYNIDNARNFKQANSIFNVNQAAKYLAIKEYPLPMDYALPVFSWTLVYRNNRFLKVFSSDIIPEISTTIRPGDSDSTLLQKLDPNVYLVKSPNRLYDAYNLKAGDILKVETCRERELNEASMLISKLPFDTKTTIALFDLDPSDLEKIPYEKIEAAYAPYH